MFVERFDGLMNIAELSNSQLGREISMNPSRIGRLRSGARPLPKHHEFLPGMCAYLAAHLPCRNDPVRNRTAGQIALSAYARQTRTEESAFCMIPSK